MTKDRISSHGPREVRRASLGGENLYEMRWAQGTEIVSGATITDNVASILAALRISADDLNAIRVAANLADTAAKTPLNLANLSQLYRYAIFAQALGVSIPDLISLISLTGINPFQSGADRLGDRAGGAVSFRRRRRFSHPRFQSPNSTTSTARLRTRRRASVHWKPTWICWCRRCRRASQKIAAANAITPDPSGKRSPQEARCRCGKRASSRRRWI